MSETSEPLRPLAETIHYIVCEAIKDGSVSPEEETAVQWKLKDFSYGDSGITSSGAEGTHTKRRTWYAAGEKLMERVSNYASFQETLQELHRLYPAVSDMGSTLRRFVSHAIGDCLSTYPDCESAKVARLGELFVRELGGGPIKSWAKAELSGITLRSSSLDLEPRVRIRQPTRVDLERVVPVFGLATEEFKNPSAILEIELDGPAAQMAIRQVKLEQCIALLRLFNTGSVMWSTCEFGSESVINPLAHGTLTAGVRKGMALETYVVKQEDETRLNQFWGTMLRLLPRDVHEFQKQISHLTLAYDRYSDALLQNGIIERRIANAIMGLEALFLDENQELSYRLAMRVSKMVSFLGKNPLQTRSLIDDAYGIRSTFAHGGHLAYKKKKKLEVKYGEVIKLLRQILDCLRTAIVTVVVSRKSREEIIDMLDDALIDPEKDKQARALMSGAKGLVTG